MKPNRLGFTLIELLVVIAIIGTLASVVLASLNSARESARVAAALQQMQQINTKMLECRIMKNGYVYCYGDSSDPNSSGACGGGGGARPVAGTSICGTQTGTPGAGHVETVWPDVSQFGFEYGVFASTNINTGEYDFSIRNPDAEASICCTENGCQEIPLTNGSACQ